MRPSLIPVLATLLSSVIAASATIVGGEAASPPDIFDATFQLITLDIQNLFYSGHCSPTSECGVEPIGKAV